MRKFIILMLFIHLCFSGMLKEKIDLYAMSNSQAAKLLYEFELKDMDISREKARELFDYDQSNVHAMFYDLNSDGVNEIIGYINSSYFYCAQGYELFVLRKSNNEYKRITYVHFYPGNGLFILGSKNYGFFDLKVHHTRIYNIYEPEFHIKLKEAFSILKYNPIEQCYTYFPIN